MVYSEFITAKGVLGTPFRLTTPLSCYKFIVNHGFLGLIALVWEHRIFGNIRCDIWDIAMNECLASELQL